MSAISNITLHLPPPTTAEIGSAYTHLVLGVEQHIPGLLNTYLGSGEWLVAVSVEPPSLEALRQRAVAVATAVQQSKLPRNRSERLLRNVRALLWLIRAQAGEQIIFNEQVRLLLDVQPESAGEAVFQTAHEALAANLSGSGSLVERWTDWQIMYTVPATQALPLLKQAFDTLWGLLGDDNPLTATPAPLIDLDEVGGSIGYRQGQPHFPSRSALRIDRLYHLAAQAVGWHSLRAAAAQRYAAGQGEAECAVLLNRGPEQIISQGLPWAILADVDLYTTAIPTLLAQANLPAAAPNQLRAIHLAEDALQWAVANAALLLHSEGLRPRAIRRHLMAHGLFSQEEAEHILDTLTSPVEAAHIFAPLIGGPLLRTWLAQKNHSVSALLSDPPVPSIMLSEV